MKYVEEQQKVIKIINKIISNKKLGHAYLLETNGYYQSFEIALFFAQSIILSEINSNDKIKVEKLISSKNFPEIKIIEPSGNIIKKEQLKELQKEFNNKPVFGKYKVYIINNADKMNLQASNSLLKFLEEPEKNIVAILVTNNRYNLISTIISRCQIIKLSNISSKQNLKENLAINLFNNTLEQQQFIENDIQTNFINNTLNFITLCDKNKKETILYENKYVLNYIKNRQDLEIFNKIIIFYYSDLLNVLTKNETKYFKISQEEITEKKIPSIIRKINILEKLQKRLDNNVNINLYIDKLILELGE